MVTNKQLLWYGILLMFFGPLLVMTGESMLKGLGAWLFAMGNMAFVVLAYNKIMGKDGF